MWVRGLKRERREARLGEGWSHPVWVRGLKLGPDAVQGPGEGVAPRVGAWIETKRDS